MRPRWLADIRDDERGSVIPLIIGFFLIASLIVTGTAAAGGAFFAQRDLQSVCDGAALAGAQALDSPEYYDDFADDTALPLSEDAAAAAVQEYIAERNADGGSVVSAATGLDESSVEVIVHCSADVNVPFGGVLQINPVGRDATGSARANINQ